MNNKSVDQEVKREILSEFDQRQEDYELFSDSVRNLLTTILRKEKINCNAITCRSKTKESLSEKIERKQGKYSNLREITDISGIRVITYYSDDVDKVAQIIEQEFVVDKENSIDKRNALDPDRFGYCSVHYVVAMKPERLALCEYSAFEGMKCEIQIRSVLQHAWAEIEHDIGYKSEIEVPKDLRRGFSRIAGLLEIADKEFVEIRESLENYKEKAAQEIDSQQFMCRDIDAVLVAILIETDERIKLINNKVSDVTRCRICPVVSNSDYQNTIKKLHWLGIKTVDDVKKLLLEYTEVAVRIVEEYLKDYISDKNNGKFYEDVAFFYLAYAKLIKDRYKKDEIIDYLNCMEIGSKRERKEIAQELFDLADKIDL